MAPLACLTGSRRRHQDAESKQPLMSPSMNHLVPHQVWCISVRAVWHPLCGLNPCELSENCGS